MAELSNSILRRLAATQTAAGHLEADTLAAFAEGALLAGERQTVLAHLAVCPECREVLALAAAAAPEPETVSVVPEQRSWARWLMGRRAIAAAVFACLVIASAVMLRMNRQPAQLSRSDGPVVATSVPPASPEQGVQGSGTAGRLEAGADRISPAPIRQQKKERNDKLVIAQAAPPKPRTFAVSNGGPSSTVEVSAAAPAVQIPASQPSGVGGVAGGLAQVAPQQQAQSARQQQNIQAVDRNVANLPAPPPVVADGSNRDAANFKQNNAQSNQANSGVPVSSLGDQTVTAGASIKNEDTQQQNGPLMPQDKMATDSFGAFASTAPGAVPRQKSSIAAKALRKPLKWIISAEGRLQRTFDGKSWETVPVGASVIFRAFDAAGQNVWAGGVGAALYRSMDNGQHWSRVVPIEGSVRLTGDVVSVHTVGIEGRIVRLSTSTGQSWISSDAGEHWQLEQ